MAAPVAAYVATRTKRGLLRRLLPWLLLLALLGLALLVAVIVALFGGMGSCGGGAGASSGSFAPSKEALSDIPGNYLGLYREAGKKYGIDWAILAGIGSIETDHGRLDAPGVNSSENFAGAGGPMQFLSPTWDQYGVDGDKDGDKDRMDPRDAIPGAANYLKASGGQDNIDDAIFAYNHAGWYVADVKDRAEKYRGAAKGKDPNELAAGASASSPTDSGGGCAGGGGDLAVGAANAGELLRNKNVTFADPQMEADLKAGRIDPRIIATLDSLGKDHKVLVTSLLRPGDSDSNHSAGRAVDIAAIDGENCTNTAKDSPCGKVAQELDRVEGKMHSTELIFCFDPGPSSGSFAAADHCDHVHVGFDG